MSLPPPSFHIQAEHINYSIRAQWNSSGCLSAENATNTS